MAPADYHLLVLGRRVRLSRGPSENGHRPAIDPLFRSAARAAGARVIAVVLSGSRDDGAVGAATVAAVGGAVVAQDPEDAMYSSMPRAAMARAGAQHVATAVKLGGLITELTAESIGNPDPVDDPLHEAEVAIDDFAELMPGDAGGTSSVYGCPTCGGGLYEVESNPLPRYRCRVGHAWSPESLLEEQAVATESALWMALRALEEKSALSRRMAGSSAEHPARARFARLAEDADNAGALIRDLLSRLTGRPDAHQE